MSLFYLHPHTQYAVWPFVQDYSFGFMIPQVQIFRPGNMVPRVQPQYTHRRPPITNDSGIFQRNTEITYQREVKKKPNKNFHQFQFIETIEECVRAVQKLMTYAIIAVDIEGNRLSREGRICIIQIATYTEVFIFDIVALDKRAFEEGGLKLLLENEASEKLFFDARKDAEALKHQFGCMLNHVLDLQILYTIYRHNNGETMQFLPSMVSIFGDTSIFSKKEKRELEYIKKRGKKMFTDENFQIWEMRPLPRILQKYAINDVVLLYKIQSLICHSCDRSELRRLSEIRLSIARDAENEIPQMDRFWREVDFLPDAPLGFKAI